MFETLYTDEVVYLSTRDEFMQNELRKQGKCACNKCIDVAYADSRKQWVERYAR